jgi:hypothetical protein
VESAIARDVQALVTVGYCSPSLPGNTLLSPALLLALQMYWQGNTNSSTPVIWFVCGGTCHGTVHGAGISKSTFKFE